MINHRMVNKFLWVVLILISSLACNAAAQWIRPDTPSQFPPTPQPTIIDLTNSPPLSTSTAVYEPACTALLPQILKAPSSESSGGVSVRFESGEGVRYLVVYTLDQDILGVREDLLVPGNLEQEIDSRASHEYVWNYFASLIPAEERSFVTEFSILSDGRGNILAGVSPTYENPSEWTLKVDVVDADDPYGLTYALLHEFGHFLTLQPSQVPPDSLVFYHPDDQVIYEQAVAACPRYFTGEGCSNEGSYINEFFNRFWSSIYGDWQEVDRARSGEDYRHLLRDFYKIYSDQFLSEYAATSPEEDIAEAWVHFLLAPKPQLVSIADEKILFFYEFPELVALREEVLRRLCTSFPSH